MCLKSLKIFSKWGFLSRAVDRLRKVLKCHKCLVYIWSMEKSASGSEISLFTEALDFLLSNPCSKDCSQVG